MLCISDGRVVEGCTPVAQPMDRGVIAKLKAIVRRMYTKFP